MNWHFWSAVVFIAAIIALGIYEFGWGGGDPHSKDHNRPTWNMW